MPTPDIAHLANTLRSVELAIPELEAGAERLISQCDEIIEKTWFRPDQDEQFAEWFTGFLNLRGVLWEHIDAAHEGVSVKLNQISSESDFQCFVIGFVAACHVVKLDRLLLERVATDSIIQRKLNEGIPQFNVPRKQYSRIFESFVDASNAHRIYQAVKFLDDKVGQIQALHSDPDVGSFVKNLDRYRSWLDESKRNYVRRLWIFIQHAFRRRGATIKQHAQFQILEASGRVVSEIVNKNEKHVTEQMRQQTRAVLRPGDVLVTRHRLALTNLFLPGFWPHSAVYVGDSDDRQRLGIEVSPEIAEKWQGDICTFEALKDGVKLRTLHNTLAVDSFVVLRPDLSDSGLKQGIERMVSHEGKQYNFDFDFFRSDRLVCTEVVYRAYDGIERMKFELSERAGRPTLAAEDLCDLALDSDLFQVVAICGVPGADGLVTDLAQATTLLKESYRKEASE